MVFPLLVLQTKEKLFLTKITTAVVYAGRGIMAFRSLMLGEEETISCSSSFGDIAIFFSSSQFRLRSPGLVRNAKIASFDVGVGGSLSPPESRGDGVHSVYTVLSSQSRSKKKINVRAWMAAAVLDSFSSERAEEEGVPFEATHS